jgi:hypothetical protein
VHRLEGDGPLDELARLLTSRGLPARLADGDATGAAEAILLEPPGPARVGLVWETAHDAGVVIRSLEPAHRPLEEIFVQTLRAADEADATSHGGSGREVSHAAS